VWMSDTGVLPGDNIWLETGKALESSKAMVVLVSPESMRSEHVRREIEYALGHTNYRDRIFPIRVRPTGDVPWILRKFQIIDGKKGPSKVSESIATALEQVA